MDQQVAHTSGTSRIRCCSIHALPSSLSAGDEISALFVRSIEAGLRMVSAGSARQKKPKQTKTNSNEDRSIKDPPTRNKKKKKGVLRPVHSRSRAHGLCVPELAHVRTARKKGGKRTEPFFLHGVVHMPCPWRLAPRVRLPPTCCPARRRQRSPRHHHHRSHCRGSPDPVPAGPVGVVVVATRR